MADDDLAPASAFDEDQIEEAIRSPHSHAQAVDALAQIRVGREGEIPSADGLDAAADLVSEDRAKFWVAMLNRKGCLATFVLALRKYGLAMETQQVNFIEQTSRERSMMFDTPKLSAFLTRIESFRCKVRVNGDVRGSGILVGPSSVLTAWHVIATGGPDDAQGDLPEIDVVLADGRAISVASLPVFSPCGSVEWPPNGGRAPKTDDEVVDRHDVALLRLKQLAGIHLTFAALATPSYQYPGRAAVVLVSYPEGQWNGVEFGKVRLLNRSLTARWGYSVEDTRPGSSGGGCFDTDLHLAGIHQGRAGGSGRLVPLFRFDENIRGAISEDEIPTVLWSLDGTPDSGLIVGRDNFFVGYQTAMRRSARAKGIWIRRVNLRNDVSGLPFSFEMLNRLVARSPEARLFRVSFDSLVQDLPNEIARRAADSGLEITAPESMNGAAADQTEPEAVVADRSRRLAQILNEKANEIGVLLWVFFDHPSVTFGDESRWALTAFVDQALRLSNLRVALAGFEAMQMPGAQFESPAQAQGDGAPGLMIEYLTHVNASDVRNLINAAARDSGRTISQECVDEWTSTVLKGLTPVNGLYDSALRSTIASKLQPMLQQLVNTERAHGH